MPDDDTANLGDRTQLSQPLPDSIDTERLKLRAWSPDRAEELAAVVANSISELRPWMPWIANEPLPIEQRRANMAEAQVEHQANRDAVYFVLLDDRIIGSCGLHTRQGPGKLEVEYWIDSSHTGRGFATEVASALAGVAQAQPGITSVVLHHDRANTASGRVAAKSGFVFAMMEEERGPRSPGDEGITHIWRQMALPRFIVRAEHPADFPAIKELVAAAFGSRAEAKLVDDIRRSPEYVPELALVAEIDRPPRVVGHVMISGCTLRSDNGIETSIKMLSPLAVHPDVQRHGIGAALVKAVVDLADEAGEPLVVLEGSPTYYPRVGFEPAMNHGIKINLPEWAPPEAGQVVRLGRYNTGLQGTVIYPDAFEGLD